SIPACEEVPTRTRSISSRGTGPSPTELLRPAVLSSVGERDRGGDVRSRPSEVPTPRVTGIRAVSSSAALVLVAVLLTACAPPPRPATLDDAIEAAINDAGLGSAEQLYRGGCENRTCVVVAKADDPRSIALIVLDTAAPYRVIA